MTVSNLAEELDVAASTRYWDVLSGNSGNLLPQVRQIFSSESDFSVMLCLNAPSIDIDSQNIETAEKNVSQNGLQSRIRIIKTKPEDRLIPLRTTAIPLEK